MIDALPFLSQDEDAQTIDQIRREKLAHLRNLANALKHTLAKLRLRRDALHHRREELRRAIALLCREADRYHKHESQRPQRSAAKSADMKDRCGLRHVGECLP